MESTSGPTAPGAGPWDKPRPTPQSSSVSIDSEALLALTTASQTAAIEAAAERRRLRSRVFWWRLTALGIIVALVVGAVLANQTSAAPHMARVEIFGVIVDDRLRDEMLNDIAEDDSVKALIVRIDSPGGTTVGGEALYESLRAVAERKPVVAVMGEVAASAGYMSAVAADHIVARGNTITASIGVIFTAPNFAGALDALGVEFVEVKSGDQKAEPSPYRPLDPNRLAAERILIDDTFEWFLDLVRDRRTLSPQAVDTVRDGRILTGRMALDLGLVDALGGEVEAVTWLREEKGLARLPVQDWAVELEDDSFFSQIIEPLFGWAGLTPPRWPGAVAGPRLISQVR